MKKIHILPIKDIRPHIQSGKCPCCPKIENQLIIHNAFDGRDRVEYFDELFKLDAE